ncbi:MAG: hydroxymethylglutaryl-CoA reductase, degradative [Chloroflexi bacterium]|nr:hydroxymethylglutaryl-CoA reductase, degradative [Chloroflexota bacterium]
MSVDENGSRLPGFFRLMLEERQRILEEKLGLSREEVQRLAEGLSLEEADLLIENVVGVFSLPLGLAPNFLIDGQEFFVPLAIEEPSVVAGASHAAKLVREGGGFQTEATSPVMLGQIQVLGLPDLEQAKFRLMANKPRLLAEANRLHPTIVTRGGGAVDLEAKIIPSSQIGPMLLVILHYDVRDSMGANAVNTVLEHLAPQIEEITGGEINLRILSNLAEERLVRAKCSVSFSALENREWSGEEVARRIVAAQALAEEDPYRAATHNKGILNGVDAVALATGNDWRSIEAAAHAYAARSGRYQPLSTWEISDQNLVGSLEIPMPVGTVGGATSAHPTARIALKILGVNSSTELGQVMGAVGLATNLAALKALATEGIQKGHMRLHARSVALGAGTPPKLVEEIASRMVLEGNIRPSRAKELLKEQKFAERRTKNNN